MSIYSKACNELKKYKTKSPNEMVDFVQRKITIS